MKNISHDKTRTSAGHHIPEWFWRMEGAASHRQIEAIGNDTLQTKGVVAAACLYCRWALPTRALPANHKVGSPTTWTEP